MISPSDLHAGDIVMTSVPEPWYLAVVLRCEGDTAYLSGRDITDDNSQPECYFAKSEEIVPFHYRTSLLKSLFHKPGDLDDKVSFGDTVITVTRLYGGPNHTFKSENRITNEKVVTGGQGVHDCFLCIRMSGLDAEADRLSATLVSHYRLK